MQQAHMHKAVTGHIEAKKLPSCQRHLDVSNLCTFWKGQAGTTQNDQATHDLGLLREKCRPWVSAACVNSYVHGMQSMFFLSKKNLCG